MNVPDDVQERVANEFVRRYGEFYRSPQNCKLLSDTVDKMTESGQRYSVDTVANAYHHLLASGALQQEEPEVAELSLDQQAHQKYVAELAKNVDGMTDDHLARVLQGLGVWVPKTNGQMWRD
jgi:hypothetical protein